MGGVTSSESRRIEYYAQFLDDERLTPEERAQLARHLNFVSLDVRGAVGRRRTPA